MQPATRVAEADQHGPYPSGSDEFDREGAGRSQLLPAARVAEIDPEWLPCGSDPEQESDPGTQAESESVTNGEIPVTRGTSTPERGRYPAYREE